MQEENTRKFAKKMSKFYTRNLHFNVRYHHRIAKHYSGVNLSVCVCACARPTSRRANRQCKARHTTYSYSKIEYEKEKKHIQNETHNKKQKWRTVKLCIYMCVCVPLS